jgi:prepilin-type N-terminal cleavage/methylation domain-containing protein
MFHFRKTSGFTLVELVIAITIFALLSVTISSIYIQTTYVGQKLRHSRHLAETAREITERIADDVREKGLT